MNLKDEITAYLERYGTPKSVFCQRIGITPNALWKYMHDKLEFCQETKDKIRVYIKKNMPSQ